MKKESQPQPTRLEATINGEVQRVGYRYIVQDIARKLGVKGYVQNMPDGTVKIVAEAPRKTIEKFIKTLQIKKPPIHVARIETKHTKPTAEFEFFTIKYGDPTEEMGEGFGTGLKYMDLSRAEMEHGFDSSKKEMKQGFGSLRTETKTGFDAVKTEISKGFGTQRTEMRQGFQNMNAQLSKGFSTTKNEISGMRQDMNRNFQEMSKKYDTISDNLSQAIKIIQDESIGTRNELIRAVDNLSKLVEEFVKKSTKN
jgi:acylphosphatase